MNTDDPIVIVQIAEQHVDQLKPEFIEWLKSNAHVWIAFEREALEVVRCGFKHYSARTILHFLRHHTALKQNGEGWKLNNNHSPYLARLFNIVHPQHASLFELRESREFAEAA